MPPRIAILIVLSLVWASDLCGQACRLSVAGLNRNRKVMGPVDTECPGSIHSSPFGNWGVTSNFGQKKDGHQFDGWCHYAEVCDNEGECKTACRDGWYEWNSCTSHPKFSAPNCSLYNAEGCTRQVSTTGTNVHGTATVEIPVRCPRDVDGDDRPDEGGCMDIGLYDHGQNFASLYELDPLTSDQLVQTLYFPQTPVETDCGAYGCGASGSDWVGPTAYDSPVSPAKVFAEMAAVVNGGEFVDPSMECALVAPAMFTVSAASYASSAAAPGSIVSSFGSSLAAATVAASTAPLPFELGGVSVELIEANGTRHQAQVLFVSPTQINWLVPAGLAPGEAAVLIRGDRSALLATERLGIQRVSPGLFSADASGNGAAAALAVQSAPDGGQTIQATFECMGGVCATVPIAFGEGELHLVLFATGIRGVGSMEEVSATVGGEPADVTYAGPQSEFPGLDQVNLRIPRSLAGAGVVAARVTVAGHNSNSVVFDLRQSSLQ